jgi:DNA-binding NarL/FixJ family response regulator
VTRNNKCPDIPFETFCQVVESVYDCALDPSRWQQTIGMIGELCRSHYGLLGLIDLENKRCELMYHNGYDDHYRRLFEEKYAAMNPYISRLQQLPIATVVTRAMLIDEDGLTKSEFYKEFLRPLEICDAIGFNVLKTRQRTALLAAHRRESEGRYGIGEIHLLSLLAPHVCRSMAISHAVNLQTTRSKGLEGTLESIAFGVYLTDSEGRIVFMNRAADRQVRTSDALRIGNTRLAPADRNACRTLTNAIAKATADEAERPSGDVTTLALPGEENAGLVATILPLNRGARRNFFGRLGPAAAVFVQDPVAEAPSSGEGFAKLYGLTPGELRVLLAMSPGLGVKDAAETLRISEATAKTHLQHVYVKTSTSKQTELMRLFMGAEPPVQIAPKATPLLAVPEIASACPK